MVTAYNVYVGKFWDGTFFRASRSEAKPFTGKLPFNTILWKTKG